MTQINILSNIKYYFKLFLFVLNSFVSKNILYKFQNLFVFKRYI